MKEVLTLKETKTHRLRTADLERENLSREKCHIRLTYSILTGHILINNGHRKTQSTVFSGIPGQVVLVKYKKQAEKRR